MTTVLPLGPPEPDPLQHAVAVPVPSPVLTRHRYRNSRILRSGAASSASQVLSAACSLVAVALVIHRLSPDAFGIWIALSSLMILLGFLDLGVGSALVGAIARAHAKQDTAHVHELISSAFFGLAGVAVILGALFAALYPHVDWASLLGVPSGRDHGDAAGSVLIVLVAVLVSLPLNVAQRAQAGLQEGDIVVLWRTIGTLVQMACIVSFFYFKLGLLWFVFAIVVGPISGSLLNSASLLFGRRQWLRTKPSAASLRHFRALGSTGFLFFILLMASTVAYQSDALVIAHYLGSAKAGEYGVTLRLFMFVPTIVNLALMPLWPAYADAWELGDHIWIRSTFRRSILFAVSINAAVGGLLLIAARPVLGIWVGNAISPSGELLMVSALYIVIWGISGPFAMLFNGCNVVRFQIIVSCLMVAVNLPLSIALLGRFDVAGPLIATIVAQSFIILLPMLVYKRRLLRPIAESTSDPEVPFALSSEQSES